MRTKKQNPIRRKTVKRQKGNRKGKQTGHRIWIYQKGNILYCFRVPYLRIISSPVLPIYGGGMNEEELSKKLFEELPGVDELQGDDGVDVRKMLDSYKQYGDKATLVKGLMASMDGQTLEELSDPKKKLQKKRENRQADIGSLTPAGQKLLEWVKERVPARNFILQIRHDAKEKEYTPQELRDLEEMLNHRKPDSPGVLSSMTTSTFSALESGANFLGEFLTPLTIPGNDGKKTNQSLVRFLWYPRSNIYYKKGNSKITADPDHPKYGDFMILVEPEKYADTMTYLSSNFNSVEDFFTNVMNGCQDGLCKNGKVGREPYKHVVADIKNYQPEFDVGEKLDLIIPKRQPGLTIRDADK